MLYKTDWLKCAVGYITLAQPLLPACTGTCAATRTAADATARAGSAYGTGTAGSGAASRTCIHIYRAGIIDGAIDCAGAADTASTASRARAYGGIRNISRGDAYATVRIVAGYANVAAGIGTAYNTSAIGDADCIADAGSAYSPGSARRITVSAADAIHGGTRIVADGVKRLWRIGDRGG